MFSLIHRGCELRAQGRYDEGNALLREAMEGGAPDAAWHIPGARHEGASKGSVLCMVDAWSDKEYTNMWDQCQPGAPDLIDLSNLSEAGHAPPHAWLDEAVDAQGGVRRDGAKYQARAPHLVT